MINIIEMQFTFFSQCNRALLAVLLLLALSTPGLADEDASWLVGRWQLSYDPDGAATDYLIFRANGDLISISPHGEFHGFYMLVPGAVRGVLTREDGRDLLLTFFYNPAHTELRIVTSATGKESIYTRVGPE